MFTNTVRRLSQHDGLRRILYGTSRKHSFRMVYLYIHGLEVRHTSDDALVVDAAIQRITVRHLVRILTIMTAIMVEGGVLNESLDGHILGSVGNKDNKLEIHAFSCALWEQEPAGKAQAAAVLFEVEL